jgi:hypothetical protein
MPRRRLAVSAGKLSAEADNLRKQTSGGIAVVVNLGNRSECLPLVAEKIACRQTGGLENRLDLATAWQ